ncbi:hypothetical protein ACWEQJ_01515, partial [Streptomyces cyaneofuscatus]
TFSSVNGVITSVGMMPVRKSIQLPVRSVEPFPETTRLHLVDEAGEPVAYGERGRVRLHLVSEEMFLPNVLERDTAIRIEPRDGSTVDGLADVQTYRTLDDVAIIEGVY